MPKRRRETSHCTVPNRSNEEILKKKKAEVGLHGTTAIGCHYNEGVLLAVECRSTNERHPKAILKRTLIASDKNKKFYDISSHVVGIMLGNRRRCLRMKKYLKMKCACMESISDVFTAAEQYMNQFLNKKEIFGTILCGFDGKGSRPQICTIYVKDTELVKSTDVLFVSLGSGSRHAKKLASELMGTTNEADYNYNLSLDAAVDFLTSCLFDATFRDISSGGPMCAYRVFDGSWELVGTIDILDAYSASYENYNEENILFLILNSKKGQHLFTDDLLAHFRPFGEIEYAHRVAQIRLDEKTGFYFHRLVCKTAEDASNILSQIAGIGGYQIDTKLGSAVKKILQTFPYCVNVNLTVEEKLVRVPLYVTRASRTVLDQLRSSRTIFDIPEEMKDKEDEDHKPLSAI